MGKVLKIFNGTLIQSEGLWVEVWCKNKLFNKISMSQLLVLGLKTPVFLSFNMASYNLQLEKLNTIALVHIHADNIT